MIGKNFRNGPANQQQVFELPQSTTRMASPVDGKDRLLSSRALTKFPIVVVATTTTEAALANWREQIGMLIAVAAASVLAIAILLTLYSDKSPRDILDTDALKVFAELGLSEHLTPQRSNGVRAMVERIRRDASETLAAAS